jgi:adenosylmethionine-8-amino-7-oxononanoate aminotransferase
MVMEAVSGTGAPHVVRQYPWVVRAPSPYHFWREADTWGEATEEAFEALRTTVRRTRARDVAAIMVEPVLGVGGAVELSRPYLQALRELCDDLGIFLIFDEVITGMGRTGDWSAAGTYRVTPDIMVLAKGITGGYAPLGAAILPEQLGQKLRLKGFPYGLTFAGHPVSCAAALEAMAILERERLLERCRTMGLRLRKELVHLQGEVDGIRDVRGQGLLLGVELEAPGPRRKLAGPTAGAWPRVEKTLGALRRRGILAGANVDGSTILLCPPLILGEAEIEGLVAGLRSALSRSGGRRR